MSRAAVRWAMPMPSPMQTMMSLARSNPFLSRTISKFPVVETVLPPFFTSGRQGPVVKRLRVMSG
jgi:hypothetical protein